VSKVDNTTGPRKRNTTTGKKPRKACRSPTHERRRKRRFEFLLEWTSSRRKRVTRGEVKKKERGGKGVTKAGRGQPSIPISQTKTDIRGEKGRGLQKKEAARAKGEQEKNDGVLKKRKRPVLFGNGKRLWTKNTPN